MSKVYDPILCMLVDKKASKARDGKIRYAEIISDIKLIRTNRDWEEANEKINMYARGGFITEQEKRDLREKLNAKRIKGVNDSYPHRIVENTGFNKSTHPFTLQVKNALGWANAGTFKTKEEAEKAAKSQDSAIDRAIRAIDAEKGYELDGFWIKPIDYGVEVTKNGKKVGEFYSTSEAEKWIRGKYGD